MVIAIPIETNQHGERNELVALPRAGDPARCPVTLLEQWLQVAEITAGVVFDLSAKPTVPSAGG